MITLSVRKRASSALILFAVSLGGALSARTAEWFQGGEKRAPSQEVPVNSTPGSSKREDTARAEPDHYVAPEILISGAAKIVLRLVPSGEFMMGSPAGDSTGRWTERPQHPVRITRPFYLGAREVTQQQYQDIMGTNPSFFSPGGEGKDAISGKSTQAYPVEQVSWFDAVRFCNTLSDLDGLEPFYRMEDKIVDVPDWNGRGYRLPTEAEWEYACRANGPQPSESTLGVQSARLRELAWFGEPLTTGTTHPTGQKRPNAFGFYDMHGNVAEWCWDWFDPRYYEVAPMEDPRGPSGIGRSSRIYRGGSWYSDLIVCRPNYRRSEPPGLHFPLCGLRIACSVRSNLTGMRGPSSSKQKNLTGGPRKRTP
jgi:formylglycine-generating enzyme required for sulfatase activity